MKAPGWRDLCGHLPPFADRLSEFVPHPPTNVDKESSGHDRRIRRKVTLVGVPPRRFYRTPEEVIMQTPLNLGADVASKRIVVACAARSFAPRSLANERGALGAWLKGLPAGSRIALEATGAHHRLLADMAHAAGLVVYVLNPRDVKKYAQGVGRRGKTDRLDAEVIARYIAREHEDLHPYVPRSAAAQRLEQLLKRRAKLMSLQARLAPTWRGVPGMAAELAAVAAAYARLLKRVDDLLQEAIAELPEVAAVAAQVRTIPGYGALSSVAVAHAMRWLPFTNVDAFIAHTGLDPRARDSGDMHGRRRISKEGRRHCARFCTCAVCQPAARPPGGPTTSDNSPRG